MSVNYATADGTATAPGDYVSTSGTLAFAAGQTTRTLSVTVNGDTLDEIDETYFVNLSAPVNATIGDGQGVGTINDNDGPSISIDDATVAEGDVGTVNADFDVTLSAPSPQAVSVQYATDDGTAIAPGDYIGTSGTLVFAPGQTTQPVSVTVNGDTLDEVNETYSVDLTNPTDATIADAEGSGTIDDDDPVPALSIDDVSMAEHNPAIPTRGSPYR